MIGLTSDGQPCISAELPALSGGSWSPALWSITGSVPDRIKIPAKGTPAEEAHLLSGMERFLVLVQHHRRGVLAGSLVLLSATADVADVVWFVHRPAVPG